MSLMSLHTAIISDLHLSDAEPSRPRHKIRSALWKKFKTIDFFIDQALVEFLDEIQKKSNGQMIELVLNGDIFDFDSVMALPENPVFKLHWIETRRGLFPKEERSLFKASVIIEEHALFISALSAFIQKGNSLVVIPGNHDVEFHFEKVQKKFIQSLHLNSMDEKRVRFVSWFYISNNDTLIEHGHQQDPYCLCENPLNPFLIDYNELTIRLPFGNVACRYIMNGMGLFNPHVETNYIMSLTEYLQFFFKYLIRTQPLIIWTWLWGSVATMYHVTKDRFSEPFKPKNGMEDIVNAAAVKSNASPRIVRELQELFPTPSVQNPLSIAKELWLDRLFLFIAGLVFIFFVMYPLKNIFSFSIFWFFVPPLLLMPFFIFYARSVTSMVASYKEPDENLFAKQAAITGLNRIIYGHTHLARHEFYGSVEHLNSGSWSPGFTDVNCTESVERNNYIWIAADPENVNARKAELCQFVSAAKALQKDD